MEIRLSTDRLFEDHFLAAEALTLGNIWNHRLSLDSQHTLDASPCWLVPQFGIFDLSRREIIDSRSRVPAASLSHIPFPPAFLFSPSILSSLFFFSLDACRSCTVPNEHSVWLEILLGSAILLLFLKPGGQHLHPLKPFVPGFTTSTRSRRLFFPRSLPVQSFLCCFPDFRSRHLISLPPLFPYLMKNTSHT